MPRGLEGFSRFRNWKTGFTDLESTAQDTAEILMLSEETATLTNGEQQGFNAYEFFTVPAPPPLPISTTGLPA